MQDEVRDKSVALVVKVGKTGTKLTAELLKWAMRQYLEQSRNPSIRHGKQTAKQLSLQGDIESIKVTDEGIKSFERIARKHEMDFAIKKDFTNGRYLFFFKTKDAKHLQEAFAEYTGEVVKRGKRKPSLLASLSHFKEVVKNNDRSAEKHREKGGMER